MRALIVAADGSILMTVSGTPTQLHQQAGPGESVFALTEGDDGRSINETRLKVSEDGRLVAIDGGPAPDIELQFIPTQDH